MQVRLKQAAASASVQPSAEGPSAALLSAVGDAPEDTQTALKPDEH